MPVGSIGQKMGLWTTTKLIHLMIHPSLLHHHHLHPHQSSLLISAEAIQVRVLFCFAIWSRVGTFILTWLMGIFMSLVVVTPTSKRDVEAQVHRFLNNTKLLTTVDSPFIGKYWLSPCFIAIVCSLILV